MHRQHGSRDISGPRSIARVRPSGRGRACFADTTCVEGAAQSTSPRSAGPITSTSSACYCGKMYEFVQQRIEQLQDEVCRQAWLSSRSATRSRSTGSASRCQPRRATASSNGSAPNRLDQRPNAGTTETRRRMSRAHRQPTPRWSRDDDRTAVRWCCWVSPTSARAPCSRP